MITIMILRRHKVKYTMTFSPHDFCSHFFICFLYRLAKELSERTEKSQDFGFITSHILSLEFTE